MTYSPDALLAIPVRLFPYFVVIAVWLGIGIAVTVIAIHAFCGIWNLIAVLVDNWSTPRKRGKKS